MAQGSTQPAISPQEAAARTQAAEAHAAAGLKNSHTETFTGSRDLSGACHSGFHATMRAHSPPQAAVETSNDPATCSETYVIGDAPPAVPVSASGVPEAPIAGSSHSTLQVAQASAATTRRHREPTAHASYLYAQAYFQTAWKDNFNSPYFTTFAWVQNNITWFYGNGCIHSPVDQYAYWGQDGNWGVGYFDTPSGASCSDAYSATGLYLGSRTWRTSDFCCDAWIHELRNSIHANPSGTFSLYPGDTFSIEFGFNQYYWGNY
jgi:hypothetical protein